jgi:hypothetical protein
MTDSVVDLAAKDPETFRRLLREDPAFRKRVLDEFMRLYRSDPDGGSRRSPADVGGVPGGGPPTPSSGLPTKSLGLRRGPGSVPAGRSPAPGGDFRP